MGQILYGGGKTQLELEQSLQAALDNQSVALIA
jgi:hypothetical protein